MPEPQKLVFCFPYRGVGGISLLFLRVAECLASAYGRETYLVDYPDGFMAKHRAEHLTRLLEYNDEAKISIPDGSLLIFQSMTPWSIFPSLQIPPDTRVLFWSCHPLNLIPTLPGFRVLMQRSPGLGRVILAFRNKMLRLIHILMEKRSLVFQDHTNVSTTESYLKARIADPVFLPIPARDSPEKLSREPRQLNVNGLRVAWVGRICDFKFFILKHALKKLEDVAEDLKLSVSVTIVGSGDHLPQLRGYADTLKRNTIHFTEHIEPAELDEFLCNEVDLLMSMGTSALEGARLGIPTILMDMFYRDVPDEYVFSWLCDRSGFTLAEYQPADFPIAGNNSLTERVRELLDDYDYVAARTAEYFQNHHSLTSVCQKLLGISDEVLCTYNDLVKAGLTGRGITYSTFVKIREGLKK